MQPTPLIRSLSVAPIAFSLLLSACGGGGGDAAAPAVVQPVAATAPTITAQPANANADFDVSVIFEVGISGGTAPISYQWKRNSTAISGATNARYVLGPTAIADNNATFSVDITNAAGTVRSSAATLTLTPVNGYIVTTTADLVDDNVDDGVCHTTANSCSLRAAITQANHSTRAGRKTIHVPAGTYTLTRLPDGLNSEDGGDLNLSSPVVVNQVVAIIGDSAATTIIDGNKMEGVLTVAVGRAATIDNVTIRNGKSNYYGGGINNSGTLWLTDSTVENNHANFAGGGVYSTGELLIISSTIRSNNTDGHGGGLYLSAPATAPTITIVDTTIESNTADLGAGIFNANSTLLVNDSTIKSNLARSYGGGVHATSTTTVYNSTFESNGAKYGGGIYSSPVGTFFLVNSTISGNWADDNGGGLYADGPAAIYNTTIVNNDADHDRDPLGGIGGGIYASGRVPLPRVIVVNSIIAANTLNATPIYNDCGGTLEVYGWNLLGNTDGCAFIGNGTSSKGTIAIGSIDALRNNGGLTLTHALLAGSPAIDSTVDALGCVDETGAKLTTDQRGAPRVAGARCDVGAVEYGSVVPQ